MTDRMNPSVLKVDRKAVRKDVDKERRKGGIPKSSYHVTIF